MKTSYVLDFEDVMIDVTSHFKKIDTNQYCTTGSTPIVDQSANYFCGYTDIQPDLSSISPPYIIFGDHTRRFKFVEKDFVLGADGTKVLKTKIDADHKYLFHFFKFIKLEEAGYSRHYKFLKRTKVFVPPLAEQQRIAAILDTADHILKQRESAIAKLDQLAQSVFVEMFGSQAWEVHKLSAICDLQNGYAFKSDDYVDESDVLNCRMSNIRPNGDFDIFYNARYLSSNFSEKYKEFLLKDGDVIIAMTDMAGEPKILGVPTIVDTKGKKLLLNQRVGKLVFKKQNILNIDYLKFALTQRSIKNYFKKFANGGVQINLGKSDLLSVPIAIPSYELQIIFSQKIQKLFKLKQVEIVELEKIKKLQSSLQHQSFAVN